MIYHKQKDKHATKITGTFYGQTCILLQKHYLILTQRDSCCNLVQQCI